MMVLGITQRYKTKFVTTVYYSPCASKWTDIETIALLLNFKQNDVSTSQPIV
jgi:hypothetical protein